MSAKEFLKRKNATNQSQARQALAKESKKKKHNKDTEQITINNCILLTLWQLNNCD